MLARARGLRCGATHPLERLFPEIASRKSLNLGLLSGNNTPTSFAHGDQVIRENPASRGTEAR